MDKPLKITRFQELTKLVREANAELKELRPEVLELIEKCGGWSDCYTSESKKITYDSDIIYKWLWSHDPALARELTLITLDDEKFMSYVKLGRVNVDDIPKDSRIETTTTSINTSRRRKGDDP